MILYSRYSSSVFVSFLRQTLGSTTATFLFVFRPGAGEL